MMEDESPSQLNRRWGGRGVEVIRSQKAIKSIEICGKDHPLSSIITEVGEEGGVVIKSHATKGLSQSIQQASRSTHQQPNKPVQSSFKRTNQAQAHDANNKHIKPSTQNNTCHYLKEQTTGPSLQPNHANNYHPNQAQLTKAMPQS